MSDAGSSAWNQRFGTDAPEILETIEPFFQHRSVRRFSGEAIPESTIAQLIAAAQSASTSSNLQAWSVITVQGPELRQQVAEAAGNQKQIIHAAWFFAFVADLNRINQYGNKQGHPPDALDTAEMYTVAIIDAALAAERLVCAAEAIGMGVCYIGAMRNNPDRIRELLKLPPNAFVPFGLCLGVPDVNARADIKPRLGQDQVWFRETYPTELDSSDYDTRAGEFFGAQGMATDAPWSLKSAIRTSITGQAGRENILAHLHAQGFIQR